MPLAFIKFVNRSPGYPDQGLPGSEYPDQGLPGGEPGAPDQGLPGGPNYPSFGPIHPPRPWPPLPPPVGVWPPRPWPPSPVDPDWGIDAGVAPGQPIYLPPDRVDNGLPPIASTKPPANPPPGTIWPPIAGAPEGEKFAVLVWIIGVGWRYAVVEQPPVEVNPTPPPTPEPK